MAGKQYEVIAEFKRRDPKTGDETAYDPKENNTFDASTVDDETLERYLKGIDHNGPLIREKVAKSASTASADTTASKDK
jgi:hypothetical protein